MVTSSGMRSSSMSRRRKSESVFDADGKPTSISLNPICTRVSNIFSCRAGSIGSMRAWLPSRRSTEHQRGARSIWRLGHSRSASRSPSGRKGTYLSKGIFFGIRGFGAMGLSLVGGCSGAKENLLARGRRRRTACTGKVHASRKEEDVQVGGENEGTHDPTSVADGADFVNVRRG